MASQYGITVDTKQRSQGTKGGLGSTGNPSGLPTDNLPKGAPITTQNLESGLESAASLPGKIKKGVGMGLIGAGVGIANALSQTGDQKVTQPYTTQGVLDSARNLGASLKETGAAITGTLSNMPSVAKEGVIGIGKALDSSIIQPIRSLGNGSPTPLLPTSSTTPATPTPLISNPPTSPTSNREPLTQQSEGAKAIASGDIPAQSEFKTALENTKVSQGLGGLSIQTPSGGTGSISFNDGRSLSQDKLGQLQKDIAYNSLQSTKDKFAREAAIVAQRHADYDAYKASRIGEGLNPFLQAALQSKENTANSLASSRLGAAQIQAQTNAAKLEATNALADRKISSENQSTFSKLANDPNWQSIPRASRVATARSVLGKPIGLNELGQIEDPDTLHAALSSPDIVEWAKANGYNDLDQLQMKKDWDQIHGVPSQIE